jgi:hypothetical protein
MSVVWMLVATMVVYFFYGYGRKMRGFRECFLRFGCFRRAYYCMPVWHAPTAYSWRWHHWRVVTLASGKLLSYCGPASRLEHLPKLLAPMRRAAPTSAPGPDLKLKLSMLYLNAVSSVSRAAARKRRNAV